MLPRSSPARFLTSSFFKVDAERTLGKSVVVRAMNTSFGWLAIWPDTVCAGPNTSLKVSCLFSSSFLHPPPRGFRRGDRAAACDELPDEGSQVGQVGGTPWTRRTAVLKDSRVFSARNRPPATAEPAAKDRGPEGDQPARL